MGCCEVHILTTRNLRILPIESNARAACFQLLVIISCILPKKRFLHNSFRDNSYSTGFPYAAIRFSKPEISSTPPGYRNDSMQRYPQPRHRVHRLRAHSANLVMPQHHTHHNPGKLGFCFKPISIDPKLFVCPPLR